MSSLSLWLSFVLDWVILVALAIAGAFIGNLRPNNRPFSLDEPSISFPYKGYDTVSVSVLVVISIIVPGILIFCLSLAVAPRPNRSRQSSDWLSRLWELHAGWAGLALSFVISWIFLNGMKNMFGRKRPNFLNRCWPDVSNVQKFIAGNASYTSSTGRLVTREICLNPDASVIDEGSRSFPSGHCTIAAAGLVYLSLYLAAKLGCYPPFVAPAAESTALSKHNQAGSASLPRDAASDRLSSRSHDPLRENANRHLDGRYRHGASAPLYLLAISLVPFATAVFVAASRWFDFQHHGWDIVVGFLLGTATSILSFRYYHLPSSSGSSWARVARHQNRAFWAGPGSSFAGLGPSSKFHDRRTPDVSDTRHNQPDEREAHEMRPLEPV
ncbi:hypothetical protein QQS21_012065 [Conoideocrella luteorostrata]|uniref:Phosphatidic acid phosphatase type 2/haloperoxidase domain-containing protein n=1 Tax=Conoideocrella luteorostrata TaxID=1105319 RepID=A0AAJ0FSS4_9HYPO|nr:hypothetical protein QQS21_012065 [Conoideocrella luteorostrata]